MAPVRCCGMRSNAPRERGARRVPPVSVRREMHPCPPSLLTNLIELVIAWPQKLTFANLGHAAAGTAFAVQGHARFHPRFHARRSGYACAGGAAISARARRLARNRPHTTGT